MERNMAGIVIEIPYVQVVEEKVERNTINIKLPNGTRYFFSLLQIGHEAQITKIIKLITKETNTAKKKHQEILNKIQDFLVHHGKKTVTAISRNKAIPDRRKKITNNSTTIKSA